MLKFDSYPELAIPSVPGGSAYSIESQWSGVLIKSGHITGTDEKYETSRRGCRLSRGVALGLRPTSVTGLVYTQGRVARGSLRK